MISKIKKNKDLLFFSLFGFVISTWGKLFFCQQPVGLGFDEQSFLYWDYASFLNLIPYKDFFYPYGLLFFLKTDNIFWYFVSILVSLVSIGAIYLIFKKVFNNFLLRIVLFFMFCIFLSIFQSYDSIVRYLPLIFLIFIVSYLQSNKLFFARRYIFSIGLIIGLFFSFINDLFFYSFIYIVISFLIYISINREYLKKDLIIPFGLLMVGMILGSMPLIYFIYHNNALAGLINNYELLKSVSLFAKVPFPASLRSVENIFVSAVLIISIINLIIFSFRKLKKDFLFYIKFALIIVLLLLEQKNIVRSFYQELNIFTFLLFLILLGEFKLMLQRLKISNVKSWIFILLISGICLMMFALDRGKVNSKLVGNEFNKSCYESKSYIFGSSDFKKYKDVHYYLKNKNPKVFIFPGDPVFYMIFNQTIPPYPSIYEATPFFAQSEQIRYIESQRVNYVIYNTLSTAIQDGVPDKIRGKLLFEYINNNFKVEKKIGTFEILKRK